ncbi:hypothetical protein [Parabacteroides faecis]|uniref:hypothetical protein n=1 Tax=Parabacteroides faecis TaxID=1217282 RepID=UPI00352061D7
MATVNAPSDTQYVFDSVLFTMEGAGEYDITIEGVKTKVSAIANTAVFDASGLLKSLFTIDALSNGTVRKNVAWSVVQAGASLASGIFAVVYGSNKVVSFSGDGAHITLRWISRRGELDSYEFCIYQDSRKLENIQTAGIGGLTYKLAFDQINKITLFAAMVDRETFESFTAIQESAIVQASVPDGWYNVEVEVKEYKRTKAALQDFDITIVLPNER